MILAAIKPEPADMMLIAERHRLVQGDRLAGDVIGGCKPVADRDRQKRDNDNSHQNGSGDGVRIWAEYLRHRPLSSPTRLAANRPCDCARA